MQTKLSVLWLKPEDYTILLNSNIIYLKIISSIEASILNNEL